MSFGAVVGYRNAWGRAAWQNYWENAVYIPSQVIEILSAAAIESNIYLVIRLIERVS
jgi:nitrilase